MLYITTSLEILAFSRVYLNLELSVYQEFIGYGTMVKILLNLKSLCAKGYYFIQKLQPVIRTVYLH